jgi:HEAT repeat protein
MSRFRLWAFLLIASGAFAWALGGQTLQQAASALGVILQISGPPAVASSGALSEHDMEQINAMTPQEQVTRLLEKAINHYKGAAGEISKRVEGWTGQIHTTPELETMTNTAYFASDLRVRAAALEIWLARDNLRKNSATVDELIRGVAATSDRKWYLLSNLGILGNRGVEREKVFDTLMLYLHDPDGSTRAAAINGLGLLGTENTIAPLLDVFHNDTSHDLRERAACNLADSGMLSRELRQKATPELVRFSQDPDLDATTKKWVFQALREITMQNLGDDPAAWVTWHGAHANRR